MKIGFILNKLNNGGAQRATANLANALVNNGYLINIYLIKDEEITFNIDEKISIQVIGKPLSQKEGCEYFIKEKEKESIDVFITPMHFDISYLRIVYLLSKFGIKVIVIEHASYFYPLSLKLENPSVHYKEKLEIYKNIYGLWCVNIREAVIWRELGVKSVRYMPNIFECKNIKINKQSSKIISYIGRLQSDKNVDDMIDWIQPILKSHKDWKLIIAGQGNQENYLRSKVTQLNLDKQIEFLGFIKNIENIYNKTEIIVIPSNNETFSYVLAEAKSFGIPAIIRENKFNSLITQTDGHCIFNNKHDFQKKLIKLIEDSNLRKELSKISKQSVINIFSWNNIGSIYIKTLREIETNKNSNSIFELNNIDYKELFNDIINECEYSLSNISIDKSKTEKTKITNYAKNFDKRFPLKTTQRTIAIIFLWLIFNISNFLKKITKKRKKGFFCVDWETMPEIKDTILNNLKGPTYYFQTGKGKTINKKIINQLNKSKFIVMSSETRWLKEKQDDQMRIFINHACGAFKKTGFAITKNYCNLYGEYDLVLSSSPYISKELSQAFQTPENKIIATGLPRTDKCFDIQFIKKTKKIIFDKYKEFTNKKIYLFAPTFRNENGIYVNKFNLNWDNVDKILSDNELIVVSLHPHIKNQIRYIPLSVITNIPRSNNKIFIIDDFSTFELSTICDLFITDYSSAIFEAILLNKDVALFAEDIDKYNRGFYFNYYTEGPCIPYINTDAEEFVEYLRSQIGNHYSKKYIKFKKKHLSSCDGHSTERVLSLLNNME